MPCGMDKNGSFGDSARDVSGNKPEHAMPSLTREAGESLTAFLLAPVPRREIPPVIKRAAGMKTQAVGLFLFGLFFLVLGGVFTWIFFPYNLRKDWQLDRSHLVTTGRVSEAEKSNMSINETPVYRYAFEFTASESGEVVQGVCYTTGRAWNKGDKVGVLYIEGNPSTARIEGSRLSAGSVATLFVLIFPLVGAIIVVVSIHVPLRRQWMLKNGMVGEFRVRKIVSTNVKINKQLRYRAECERVDDAMDDGVYSYASHASGKIKYLRALESSGRAVFGLYDPRDRGAKRRKLELPEAWFM
ncbi:hypothetical protein CKA38_06175 [Ereboglobus luteus]|uniref:DUF3592 domain-containing protein n=2 Tax=Ereboglobus luteus TaxID=1796921 RepID=A0A2U8E2Y9_9BACT|nr:hypothetical protein CKA38_06175 [Ereboglobus luteus]